VATRKNSDSAASGPEAFRGHFAALFGERWPALEAALLAEPDSVAFTAGEGLPPYYLDSASVFAATCLALPEAGSVLAAPGASSAGAHILKAPGASSAGAHILDACAAPGGKSLVLASRLGAAGGAARLTANELSADRRRRLCEVLDRHLSPEARARVEVTGRDAAAMCRAFESSFDAILLDAPCSSERHLLRQSLPRPGEGGRSDPRALGEWSPARIRGLALRQWSLLSSALLMLRPGGSLVYSTCALSPEENDRVVARAAARYGAGLAFDRPRYEGPGEAEETEYGLSILPDRARGAGPMYVCRMVKP
jgi:16S rRNA C967 or C1407 C5-methylase (RsmB/RsmF family)